MVAQNFIPAKAGIFQIYYPAKTKLCTSLRGYGCSRQPFRISAIPGGHRGSSICDFRDDIYFFVIPA
jgi:hypothetical protein